MAAFRRQLPDVLGVLDDPQIRDMSSSDKARMHVSISLLVTDLIGRLNDTCRNTGCKSQRIEQISEDQGVVS